MLSRRVGAAVACQQHTTELKKKLAVLPHSDKPFGYSKAASVAGCFYVCGGWDGRQTTPEKLDKFSTGRVR